MSRHKNFFVNLHTMCAAYGKSPTDYLFPDVECPHFRMLVDTLVFNIGEPEIEKNRWKRAALAGGSPAKHL